MTESERLSEDDASLSNQQAHRTPSCQVPRLSNAQALQVPRHSNAQASFPFLSPELCVWNSCVSKQSKQRAEASAKRA
ncbi:hypothetical protein ACOMHN_026224 [Nucella lapillus]